MTVGIHHMYLKERKHFIISIYDVQDIVLPFTGLQAYALRNLQIWWPMALDKGRCKHSIANSCGQFNKLTELKFICYQQIIIKNIKKE